MKKLICGIVLSVFAVTASFAADIYKAQPRVQGTVTTEPWSWTGLNIGFDLGYAKMRNGASFVPQNSFSSSLQSNNLVPSVLDGSNADGLAIGGHVGYMHQFGRLVGILEGAWAWADVDGTSTATSNLINRTVRSRLTGIGTLTGEVGYLISQNLMIKGGGGWAFGQWKQTVGSAGSVCGGGIVCGTGSSDTAVSGYVLKGGVIYRPQRDWSAGIEAQYINFGDRATQVNGSVNGTPSIYGLTQKVEVVEIKAKATWHPQWMR